MSDLYPDVAINPGSTSYFSDGENTLDPNLFNEGGVMYDDVRAELVGLLMEHMGDRYAGAHSWIRAWVAGSGVSFQWSAARHPGDLDVLIGVDFVQFRAQNPDWGGLSNNEIAKHMNEDLYQHLTSTTQDWHGLWEVTWYINPDSYDIRAINPYAAYDIIANMWTVPPTKQAAPENKYWEQASERDLASARILVDRYGSALRTLRAATNPAARVNAEFAVKHAISQASEMYEQIHGGRQSAFSRMGAGYADWGNYRWQAGKASGVVPALRMLKEYSDQQKSSTEAETYGMELPSTDTLVRRAALRRTGV